MERGIEMLEREVDDRTAPNSGTLGQSGGVPGLRLSADQLDRSHTPSRWKPTEPMGIPLARFVLVVAALVSAIALVVLAFVLTHPV
jgi:hypothetical protein